jgi:hypothetical protein
MESARCLVKESRRWRECRGRIACCPICDEWSNLPCPPEKAVVEPREPLPKDESWLEYAYRSDEVAESDDIISELLTPGEGNPTPSKAGVRPVGDKLLFASVLLTSTISDLFR